MIKRIATSTTQLPNILIVGIDAPYNPIKDIKSYYEEFKSLVHSAGIEYQHELFIKLRSIEPAYFVTKGKLDELIQFCKQNAIEEVIFSEPLSGQQERNLSQILHCPILDRTQLILNIFKQGAQSAEGKLQVELAIFQHAKSRLAGRGVFMSQQAGSIGTRGPGETQKEKDLQHIELLTLRTRRDLGRLRKVRETQRKKRLTSSIPLISLIGYTNAGKSTILNALTKSSVLAENKLFATLDTTTREFYTDGTKKALISDTVGFIQQLPHHLIEAFKSTLSELTHAHLLLEVVDLSDSNWESHIRVVHDVLEELGAADKPMLYVFNKVDKVPDLPSLEQALSRYQPHVFISALSPEGIAPLIEFLRSWKPEAEEPSE